MEEKLAIMPLKAYIFYFCEDKSKTTIFKLILCRTDRGTVLDNINVNTAPTKPAEQFVAKRGRLVRHNDGGESRIVGPSANPQEALDRLETDVGDKEMVKVGTRVVIRRVLNEDARRGMELVPNGHAGARKIENFYVMHPTKQLTEALCVGTVASNDDLQHRGEEGAAHGHALHVSLILDGEFYAVKVRENKASQGFRHLEIAIERD